MIPILGQKLIEIELFQVNDTYSRTKVCFPYAILDSRSHIILVLVGCYHSRFSSSYFIFKPDIDMTLFGCLDVLFEVVFPQNQSVSTMLDKNHC